MPVINIQHVDQCTDEEENDEQNIQFDCPSTSSLSPKPLSRNVIIT